MYIVRGGEQALENPIFIKKAHTYCFFLDASKESLQSIVDRDLNTPSNFQFNYKVLTNQLFLVYAIQDWVKPTSNTGWIPEIDAGFWILCYSLSPKPRLLFYQPYLFVDSSYGMATGREVYGFHKSIGRFQYSPLDVDQDRFIVETIVPNLDDRQATWERIIDVKRVTTQENFGKNNILVKSEDFFAELWSKLNHNTDELPIPGLGSAVRIFEKIFDIEVGMVFLKQFRDVENPKEACYQAIVEAPAKLESFEGGGVLASDYEVQLSNHPYYPFLTEFGFAGEKIPAKLASWANFGFSMEKGKTVWKR